jgi:zinc protease
MLRSRTALIEAGSALISIALVSLFLAACATAPAAKPGPVAEVGPAAAPAEGFPLAAMGASFGSGGLSAFARESLPTFETFTLSNGLPVIVKRSEASRVRNIELVIRGGSASASAQTAGYESLALRTMARGSADYSYEDIQDLLDETSSSMGSSSTFDASTYALNTLDKYFDRLFPVWVDTITRPAFRQEDFDQELANAELALQSKEKEPWAKTGLAMNDLFFAGHPYAASPDGTAASLGAASLDAIEAWYASRMRASALFVVAVGDFDPAVLRKSLEAGLGSLPAGGAALPPPVPAFAASGPGTLEKVEYPQSKGVGYLRGDFAAPSMADPDYVSLSIGMSVLSDLLFDVVRDKHGAAYSPMAGLKSFNANYGTVALYKTSIPGKAKAYIDEAAAVLASGRGMAVDPESSPDGYAPIADILAATKAQFVNSVYESQATNAAIAAQIARSALATGDYRAYLLLVDRIQAATPDSIMAAVRKYLFEGTVKWIALGAAEVIQDAEPEDFASFTATAR